MVLSIPSFRHQDDQDRAKVRSSGISEHDSRLEGRGFESYPILDGNGFKAMPGLILAPNPGSFND